MGGVRFGGQEWGLLIINIGRVGDKSFIEFLKIWPGGGGGGGEGEWQQYFDFSYITGSMKNASSTAFWAIFLFVCLKFRNS